MFQWVRFQPFGDVYNYAHHPLPTYHCFADRCVLRGSPEFSRAAGFFRVKNGFASKLHCGGHAWHWSYSRMLKSSKCLAYFNFCSNLLVSVFHILLNITKWNKVENQINQLPWPSTGSRAAAGRPLWGWKSSMGLQWWIGTYSTVYLCISLRFSNQHEKTQSCNPILL